MTNFILKLKNKKSLKIALTAVLCLVVVYLALSAYGSVRAIELPRLPLTYDAASLGIAYEDVSFKTRGDGITLKGWFFPGLNDQVLLIVHGGYQNRVDDKVNTPEMAKALVNRGYSVLLFDLRGRGESEGEGRTLSCIDEDIGGAVDFVKSRGFDIKNINLLGFSSGAAVISIYASRNEIGSLILDGCFINSITMLVRQANAINMPGFLAYFFLPGGLLFTHLFYDFHPVDPIDVMPDVDYPVLFIHEENDEFVTMEETGLMYRASTNPASEIWEAADAKHSEGFRVHPQQYIDKVDGFLQKIHLP